MDRILPLVADTSSCYVIMNKPTSCVSILRLQAFLPLRDPLDKTICWPIEA